MDVREKTSFFSFVISLFTVGGSLNAIGSDYGTTGLIDIPTARFADDGLFAVGASVDGRHRQFYVTYQATPWLQGTFRYTGFKDFFLWDRNYEIKARLWEEDVFLPQVAVGIRDIVGTGVFGSEYVVASKKIGKLDVTLGAGWGRLAGSGVLRNPLTGINNRFEVRSASVGSGGDFALGNYFSGPDIGVFGGASYALSHFPIEFMVEFNPDKYDRDVKDGGLRPKSPFSYGLSWTVLPGTDVNFSAQHGDELSLGVRFYLDSKAEISRRPSDSFVSSFYLSTAELPTQIRKNSWYDRLLYDVERSGLLLLRGGLSPDRTQAELVVGNNSYALWSDAIARHTALADLHLPATVQSIFFVIEENGHSPVSLKVPRPSAIRDHTPRRVLKQFRTMSGRELQNLQHRTGFFTGRINTVVNIRTRFQLFDPDDPARYQVFADVSSDLVLNESWALKSSIALNITHNFNESRRITSDSKLPKVRSDVVKYLNDGDTGLEKLVLEGRDTLGQSLHYRIFGGYLETMYAGVGGELLFWPFDSRIATGLSLAYAKQRDFDRGFGLRDFHAVTGHVSTYWATPFYNFDMAVHAGKFLAGDVGASLEVRRTFRNGWQVGLWATLTDVPFDEFGEGSFDKGLFFQIPLDGMFGSRTRSNFSTRIRPIQRDGGQRLEGYSGDIFWDLRAARHDSFSRDYRLLP